MGQKAEPLGCGEVVMAFPVSVSTCGGDAYVLVLYTVVRWGFLLFSLLYLVLRWARATSGPPAVPLGRCGVI